MLCTVNFGTRQKVEPDYCADTVEDYRGKNSCNKGMPF